MSCTEYRPLLFSFCYLVTGACICLFLFVLDLKGETNFIFVSAFLGVIIFSGIFFSTCIYGFFKDTIIFPVPVCLLAIAACALIVSLGLTEIIFYRVPVSHELQIKVTGQKNTSSLGKEVWLIGRRHDFNQVFDIDALEFSSGWQERSRDMVSVGNPGDTASWSDKVHSDVTIAFLMHEFSGIVDVMWDNITTRYDLYSSSRGYKPIVLPKTYNECAWIMLKLMFCITLMILLWLCGVWFLARPLTESDIQ